VHYRDSCTFADLHKLIAHFYLPSEISTSKEKLKGEFGIYLSGCQHTTNRRDTTTRPAHDAEITDILGMLEILDNLNVLRSVQFAAVSIERLPKYGPNEINICTVVDRQLHIDKELSDLRSSMHGAATVDNHGAHLVAAYSKTIEDMSDMYNGQLRKLEAVCSNIQVMAKMASTAVACNVTPSQTTPTSVPAPTDDRSTNIIVFGLAEDRNISVWNATLSNALTHVAGRPVEIVNAFRIGKFNATNARPRPIIVRLRNVWDRRLLVSNARKLAELPEFRRVGIAPDEPLETRRRHTMKRLQYKATKDCKQVVVSDDGASLFVDGMLVFSLSDGFVRSNNNASVSSNSING
jgi:hypothetical protein